ncbi:MAG: hypothetical protein ACYTDT_05435 [Planctomycetota bacterium]|jgi:hypothetical protein
MPRDEVFKQLESDFVLVAQYTDDQQDQKPKENLTRLTEGKVFAVPLYMVLDADGVEIARFVPPNNIAAMSAEDFAKFMSDAKAEFEDKYGAPK